MALEPGAIFAGYTVVRQIGVGGMGRVYLMRHPRLPMNVAVKVLDGQFSSDAKARARFEREADIAASLHHRNIVRVHDRGIENENLWIAMDFVDGPDAAELIGRGRLPLERAVDIVAQAAAGLDYAHQRGVLHRDVKPGNLLVGQEDSKDHVQIADFGIARGLDNTVTVTTSVTATFAYAAPELLSGAPVDHRADVYALGCTLYHLLSGSAPFPSGNLSAVMYSHLNMPPPRLTATRSDAPAALDEVIARSMAKDPDQRFPNCTALAEAARAALATAPESHEGPTLIRPPAFPPPTPPESLPNIPIPQYFHTPPPYVFQPNSTPPHPIPTVTPRKTKTGWVIGGVIAAVVVVAAAVGIVAWPRTDNSDRAKNTTTVTTTTVPRTTTTQPPNRLSPAEAGLVQVLSPNLLTTSSCAADPKFESTSGATAAVDCDVPGLNRQARIATFTDANGLASALDNQANHQSGNGTCSDGGFYTGTWRDGNNVVRGNTVCIRIDRDFYIATGFDATRRFVLIGDTSVSAVYDWWAKKVHLVFTDQ
ncbi:MULTISPECIES: serine/threonine-protein kinase [unclassified Nocardia]|uniref:serine/threonine-protein kinase n=1 Tax=unclassified Nocardia TaxID=2637762 RepID=UPI001CE42F9C|nr:MULTISPECIES: serine/threonine-protein kinase [unclassified Nocardia]